VARANNRPGGSHRDLVVAAAIRLVNELAPGAARGHAFFPEPGPAESAAVANRIFAEFADHRSVFEPSEHQTLLDLVRSLHAVFLALASARLDEAVPLLNDMMNEHPVVLHLSDGPPWNLHYQDHSLPAAAGWRTGCAASLASFVSSGAWEYLGVCEARQCDRVFLDDTRNRSRRYCTTRCQNRAKVAAFRTRTG
jgi:predicted RNA-binding Zn ribbon-like protein